MSESAVGLLKVMVPTAIAVRVVMALLWIGTMCAAPAGVRCGREAGAEVEGGGGLVE